MAQLLRVKPQELLQVLALGAFGVAGAASYLQLAVKFHPVGQRLSYF